MRVLKTRNLISLDVNDSTVIKPRFKYMYTKKNSAHKYERYLLEKEQCSYRNEEILISKIFLYDKYMSDFTNSIQNSISVCIFQEQLGKKSREKYLSF